MKPTIAFLVLLVFRVSSGYCSCLHWKQRMQKYGALVNCEYYVTSENEYTDFFAFDEVAKRNENNTLQIRFFTLSLDVVKFMLSENNSLPTDDASPSDEIMRTKAYDYYSGWHETTTLPYVKPKPKKSIWEHNFQFVFGSNEYYGRNFYMESYVTKESKRLKTLTTPGIIRKNEPNEVLIEIFPEGKIRTTINGNDAFELRGYDIDALKYISFLSPQNQMLAEFFYNCKQ